MKLFAGVVSALAAVATLVLFAKAVVKDRRWRQLIYPTLLVPLVVFSTCQLQQNQRLTNTRNQARQLVESWPDPGTLEFQTKGENFGIALSGLAFLEKNRASFPETYHTAVTLFQNRLRNFTPPVPGSPEDQAEFHLAEDVAGAIIRLVASVAECASPPNCEHSGSP